MDKEGKSCGRGGRSGLRIRTKSRRIRKEG
jgi:hypothetical protein